MTRELLQGLTHFKKDYFRTYEDRYRKLVAEGQKPGTLFIGCSDSRVVPSIITDSGPGDLFVVRNVGNIVPRYEVDEGHHGVSAAIDFAVDVLEVRDIVVCGHSHCGAMQALYDTSSDLSENLRRWLELAAPAKVDEPVSEAMLRRTEQRSIVVQLDRLMEFPNVRSKVEAGRIALHGWHYVIEDGTVHILDAGSGAFVPHG
ncbi:MAG: carbonic anhydrase [Gemmatimonadota bacterium]|nr:carbonic anhydrase [Gemmatimonadota bacterium]